MPKPTQSSNPWILIIPTAIGVMILNAGAHLLFMFIYGTFINPGQNDAFYRVYAKWSAPFSSIVAGIPLMYLAARWLGSKFFLAHSIRVAVWMWLSYALIDFAFIYFAGELGNLLPLLIASLATKLGAAYLGGQAAHRSFS